MAAFAFPRGSEPVDLYFLFDTTSICRFLAARLSSQAGKSLPDAETLRLSPLESTAISLANRYAKPTN
jgi:hypothetical protein